MNNAVVSNLAIWLNVDTQTIEDYLANFSYDSRLDGLLDLQVVSPIEGVTRRLLHRSLLYYPEKIRYFITDTMKKLRQLIRKDLVEISNCAFVEIYLKMRKYLNLPPLWNNYKGVVCLSHDVDSLECYEFIPKVLELEKKYRVKSNFNFLTNWGYKVDRRLLEELDSDGFEVGLHGYTHDIAFGCRRKSKIKDELQRALDELDFPVKGYRAPAFSITKKLLEVLVELGIKYDSSMKTLSCYGQGVETCYPYKYPNIDIWEVPLIIQDDRVFRDLHLSCEEGVGVVKELTSRIIDVNGVAVINTHPRIIKKKYRFYGDLLYWLSKRDDLWVCTMGEVVEFMENCQRISLAD